jgi:hypothetical protein
VDLDLAIALCGEHLANGVLELGGRERKQPFEGEQPVQMRLPCGLDRHLSAVDDHHRDPGDSGEQADARHVDAKNRAAHAVDEQPDDKNRYLGGDGDEDEGQPEETIALLLADFLRFLGVLRFAMTLLSGNWNARKHHLSIGALCDAVRQCRAHGVFSFTSWERDIIQCDDMSV